MIAKLILCLLLDTVRLICVTNDEGLAFIRAVSVSPHSDRNTSLALLRSFHLSLGDGLIGRKAVEKSHFVRVINLSKRESFQTFSDGVALRRYLLRVNRAALTVGNS